MNYKIRAWLYFKDGSILPREVRQGEVIDVTENEWKRIQQSGGRFEVVGNSVPPSTSEEQNKKAGKKK